MASQGQHFLSQGYLKGFTPLGTKESRLIAFNLKERKHLKPTIPYKFAKQRNFNRIEIDGIPPNYLEEQLALFEEQAGKAISNVENTRKFTDDNRLIILNLIALFAVRNPYRREHFNNLQDQIAKIILSAYAKNESSMISEDFKKVVNTGNFKVKMPKSDLIKLELSALDRVIHSLVERKWILIEAPDNLTFITCDRPVVLTYKEENKHYSNLGFDLKKTQVCFPLSKKFALIGDFEGEDRVIVASEKLVGSINSSILCSAASWLYTVNGDFIFLKHTGELAYGLSKFWNYFATIVDVHNDNE